MLCQACDAETARLYAAPSDHPDFATRIATIRTQLEAMSAELSAPAPTEPDLGRVQCYLRARTNARGAFGTAVISDPAFDMLVQLYACELAQQRIAMSRLCALAHVPTATGQRWLKVLEDSGQVEREADPLDARRIRIRLTRQGSDSMRAFFDTLAAEDRVPA